MSLHGGSAYPHDKNAGAGKLDPVVVGNGVSAEMIDRKIAEVGGREGLGALGGSSLPRQAAVLPKVPPRSALPRSQAGTAGQTFSYATALRCMHCKQACRGRGRAGRRLAAAGAHLVLLRLLAGGGAEPACLFHLLISGAPCLCRAPGYGDDEDGDGPKGVSSSRSLWSGPRPIRAGG